MAASELGWNFDDLSNSTHCHSRESENPVNTKLPSEFKIRIPAFAGMTHTAESVGGQRFDVVRERLNLFFLEHFPVSRHR